MGTILKSRWLFMMVASGVGTAGLPAARADVLTFTPSSDATIFGTSAGVDTTKASGMGPGLFAGADSAGNITRSGLEFNVSSIPSNATITGATLTLYLGQVAGSSGGTGTVSNAFDRQFGLYPLLQAWTEGTSGSPTSNTINGSGGGYTRVNGDVSWDYANYNSTPALATVWGSTATPIHGGNFSATESALLDVPVGYSLVNNAPFSWSSAGMAGDVQGWVNGSLANNGWMLKSDNLEATKPSFLGFWSKDGATAVGNAGLTPTLSVTFTVPAPEPASALMLAGAVPLLLRPRRRSKPAGGR